MGRSARGPDNQLDDTLALGWYIYIYTIKLIILLNHSYLRKNVKRHACKWQILQHRLQEKRFGFSFLFWKKNISRRGISQPQTGAWWPECRRFPKSLQLYWRKYFWHNKKYKINKNLFRYLDCRNKARDAMNAGRSVYRVWLTHIIHWMKQSIQATVNCLKLFR